MSYISRSTNWLIMLSKSMGCFSFEACFRFPCVLNFCLIIIPWYGLLAQENGSCPLEMFPYPPLIWSFKPNGAAVLNSLIQNSSLLSRICFVVQSKLSRMFISKSSGVWPGCLKWSESTVWLLSVLKLHLWWYILFANDVCVSPTYCCLQTVQVIR